MNVNWDSILGKARAHMKSPERKKEIRETVDRILFGVEFRPGLFDLYEVGDVFARVLWDEIQDSSIPRMVKERLADISVSEPKRLKNGNYSITVSFSGDLERASMSTRKDYGYKINLARLYNDGWSDTSAPPRSKTIFEWFDRIRYQTTPNIIGAEFADRAVRAFMEAYGDEYGVTDIRSNFNV